MTGDAGWQFVVPFDGLCLTESETGRQCRFSAGQWESGIQRVTQIEIDGQRVVGARQAGVAPPAGGSVVDAEARAALTAVLAALSAHGLVA